LGAVENDAAAVRTYAWNFHQTEEGVHAEPRDIRTTKPLKYVGDLTGASDPASQVDVIVGGPPCPTFSRIGRPKINHEANKGLRFGAPLASTLFLQDERNHLYREYLRFVKELRPLALVMENVGGFMSQANKNHAEVVARQLKKLGYETSYTILNSAWYGVPQSRDRFFLVAFHNEALGKRSWSFPRMTHHQGEDPGVTRNRKGFWNLGGEPKFPGDDNSQRAKGQKGDAVRSYPSLSKNHARFVTTLEALRDLPSYEDHKAKKVGTRRSSWKKSEKKRRHRVGRPGSYSRFMRNWTWGDVELEEGFFAHHHVCRRTTPDTKRDEKIIAKMKPGDDYLAAHRIGMDRYKRKVKREEKRTGKQLSSWAKKKIKAECVPPYPTDKFRHKWWMLDPQKTSRTLTAHLGKDCYSHIHYDSKQARMITVQEAARLQSFPDSFEFRCSMNDAFKQIGNAVSPLVAAQLASSIYEVLKDATLKGTVISRLIASERNLPRSSRR
jgi:DNA (cytosine-5)-methyltransferase 1